MCGAGGADATALPHAVRVPQFPRWSPCEPLAPHGRSISSLGCFRLPCARQLTTADFTLILAAVLDVSGFRRM